MALAVLVAASGCAFGRSTRTADAVRPTPALARGIAEADSLVRDAVGRLTPGAVLLIAKDGVVLHERAYGHAEDRDANGRPLPAPRAMRTSTIFDLASVTKVMATTMAVMLLVDRGRVDVDAPLHRYLPEFRGPRLDSVTVRHLLTHSSGLVQWQPMYYHGSTPQQVYEAIRTMPLGWGVGAGRHYSDLGFMLLGYLVERVGSAPLDVFVERELYVPLGLRRTLFRPRLRGFSDFAATETGNAYEHQMVYDPNFGYDYAGDPRAWDGWRRQVLVGEVNDGNAHYAHGGVAGHAGLFSTASELRVLIDLLTNRGVAGGRRFVRGETIDLFLTKDRYGHYLGWQSPPELPPGSFSHTGFTGTYVLGVTARGLAVVLLTNRQHMGRDARGYFPDLGPLQRAIAKALTN